MAAAYPKYFRVEMTVPIDYPISVLSYGREKVRSHSAVYLGNIAKFG